MRTPPGLSEATFESAITQFKKAVGESWVYTAEQDTRLYRDAYSPFLGEPEERWASAAVAPASVEEVQAVVRAANQFKVPLYTLSTLVSTKSMGARSTRSRPTKKRSP